MSTILSSFKRKIFDTPELEADLIKLVNTRSPVKFDNFDRALHYLLTIPEDPHAARERSINVQKIIAYFLRKKVEQTLMSQSEILRADYLNMRAAHTDIPLEYPIDFREFAKRQGTTGIFATELACSTLSILLSFNLKITQVGATEYHLTELEEPLFSIHLFNWAGRHFSIGEEWSLTVADGNCFYNAVAQCIVREIQPELVAEEIVYASTKDGLHPMTAHIEETSPGFSSDDLLKSLFDFTQQKDSWRFVLYNKSNNVLIQFNMSSLGGSFAGCPELGLEDLKKLAVDSDTGLPFSRIRVLRADFSLDLANIRLEDGRFVVIFYQADNDSKTEINAFCENLNQMLEQKYTLEVQGSVRMVQPELVTEEVVHVPTKDVVPVPSTHIEKTSPSFSSDDLLKCLFDFTQEKEFWRFVLYDNSRYLIGFNLYNGTVILGYKEPDFEDLKKLSINSDTKLPFSRLHIRQYDGGQGLADIELHQGRFIVIFKEAIDDSNPSSAVTS